MSDFEKTNPITDQLTATAPVQEQEARKLQNLRALKTAKQFLAISFLFAVAVTWLVISHAQTDSLNMLDGLLVVACGYNIHTSLARYRSAKAELLSAPDAA